MLLVNVFKQHPASHLHTCGKVFANLRLFMCKSQTFHFHTCGGKRGKTVCSVHPRRALSRKSLHSQNAYLINSLASFSYSERTFFTTCLKQAVNKGTNGNGTAGDNDTSLESGQDVSPLLEKWFYEVSPYGALSARLPFNTVIKPLNSIDYPDMNKCIIELCYNTRNNNKTPSSHQLSQISDLYKLDVTFDEDKAKMNVSCDLIEGVEIPVCCYIQVPLKCDLMVKMIGGESVSIESMESNSISVEADKGNVNLRKIKSGSVSVFNKSGDIVSEATLLGNADLHCGGSGRISADKVQGSSVTCSTEMGSVAVKSLYTETATFKTLVGDLHLGHCHGQICVVGEKSNLCIDSLDGDLDAGLHEGSVHVLLSRHNKVDIDLNTGDIGLSFPEGARTDVTLSCPSITIGDNLSVTFDDTDMPHYKEGSIGERGGGSKVSARTLSGMVTLDVLDWIKTTKLAFMTDRNGE